MPDNVELEVSNDIEFATHSRPLAAPVTGSSIYFEKRKRQMVQPFPDANGWFEASVFYREMRKCLADLHGRMSDWDPRTDNEK